jgi:hypothetical protein
LYRRHPDAYPDWRNAFAVTSVMSLVVVVAWPVLPPRLFVGGGALHLQDTLTTHASLWSFAGPMGSVANQVAAMPSVHCAWAVIVAAVVAPRARHRSVRIAALAHPVLTAFAVIATGNHYVLDVVGGIGVVVLGRIAARVGHRWIGSRNPGVRARACPTTSVR